MHSRKFFSLLGVLVLLLTVLPVAAAQPAPAKIEARLLDQFGTAGTADMMVRFFEQADLTAAYAMDWEARGLFVYNTLTETAARSQARAVALVESMGLEYRTFIAGNELYIWAGDRQVATLLAALPEVAAVDSTWTYYLDPILPEAEEAIPEAPEWGILDTKADQFWTAFGVRGDGIVVANIDTGVRYTHEALYPSYKCGAGPHTDCWLDPQNGTTAPTDGHNHGSHTMGTMVGEAGANQIGMAPNAQWIACSGCPGGSCPEWVLNACADWMLAPGGSTANRPHLVNNSWGGRVGTCDPWYHAKVVSWRAAGIFPAFSAGNSGSGCNSLGVPSVYQASFASAAHDVSRTIASFSSRGPAPQTTECHPYDPYTKPNISGPGVSVRSAGKDSNTHYYLSSGTSMSSPHTAGAVALLWSCNPSLIGNMAQTFEILQDNADAPPTAGNCGAPPTGNGNYTWGYGVLNIYAAGLLWCGDIGYLDGHVYEAVSGDPLAGATIDAGGPTAVTNQDGYYHMTLAEGTYDVAASHPLYTTVIETGVAIAANLTTTVDFELEPKGRLWGYVTDYDNGFPLEATVTADDGTWAETDASGYYELYLDAGTYVVTATAQDYADGTATVDIVSGEDTQQDFQLVAAVVFIPTPLHVTVAWQATYQTVVTLSNRMAHGYDFEFQEQPGGFVPMGGQEVVAPQMQPSIPAAVFTGVAPEGYVPPGAVAAPGPQGPWQTRASAPTVSMDNVYLDYENKGYQLGGYGWTGGVAIYDADANTWTTGATEPAPRIQYPIDGCFGFNASGDPVGILFNDATSGATTLHRYNMATNAWDTPPVPAGFPANGLWGHDIASVWRYTGENVCYISGGATAPGGGNTSALYAYYPDTNTVVNLGNFSYLAQGFAFHASWYAPWIGASGGICVAGGVNAGSVVSGDTQCYDIAAGVFNATNADLGALPTGLWGMADSVLYEDGDYQLWVAQGADAAFALWPNSAYYSQNDGQWYIGPTPPRTGYRVEGTNIPAADGCSFYVVGGSSGGFTPTSGHERNYSPDCPPVGDQDVLWFGQDPEAGTVPAGDDLLATMLFTATFAVGVDQPGDYYCNLRVQGDPRLTVRVTMTVLPSDDWGQLHGYVLDNCTGDPVEATITIPGIDPFKSNKDTGYYSIWLEPGDYDVNFGAAGYLDYDDSVTIVEGEAVELNVDLVPNRPCIAVDPLAFEVWVLTGTQELRSQEIANPGGQPLTFEYREIPGGYAPGVLVNPLVPMEGTTGPIPGWHESDAPPPGLYVTQPTGPTPDAWGEGTVIPTGAQYQGAAATIDNENFYLFGGYGTTYLNQCQHYNTTTGVWTACAPMSIARGNLFAYYNHDDGKIYVPGGWNGSYLNHNHRYDPATNTWEVLAPLPIAKAGANGGIVDGKMYIFGGNGGTAYNDTQIYDIAANTWSAGAPMPITTHRYGDNVTYQGQIYVLGSFDGSHFVRYDPATNSWQQGPNMTVARNSANCVVTPDGIIYCWGGGNGWTVRNDGEYYNLANWPGGSWTTLTDPIPYGTVRGGHTCAVDRLWIEGGAPSPFHNRNQWWEGLGMTCYWPGEAPDVPWVWEDPVTGTVAPQDMAAIEIGFTSWYVSGTETIRLPLGTYTATLRIMNNDAETGMVEIPLTMHIVEDLTPPTAAFDSNSPVCLGEEMVFTNLTVPGVPPATDYEWDFGDGNTSTEEHPTHLYDAAGAYTVTLEACNDAGCDTAEAVVEVLPLPVAGFDYAADGLEVTFTNLSEYADEYLWDLGDGITSTLEHPVHVYDAAGVYTVTLWAFNDCGADMAYAVLEVAEPCDPVVIEDVTFEADRLTVTFTSAVTGTEPIAYWWDFGDGVGTSDEPHPVYTYGEAGCYTVTLLVTNTCGTDTWAGEVCVDEECVPPHDADFDWTPAEPAASEEVTFSGTAGGTAPLSYAWAFGDGQYGTGPTVVHIYAEAGVYTVVMTVTNECGEDVVTHEITVSADCVPPYNVDFDWTPAEPTADEEVTFSGTAAGTAPLSYAWAFGDGAYGSGQTVVHTYAEAGVYTVVMTVTNECGEEVVTHEITVSADCVPPYNVDFTWLPVAPVEGQEVAFSGSANGTGPLTYEWAFGDGNYGAGQNVVHTYAAAGDYTVVMTVTGACGDPVVVTKVITVLEEPPPPVYKLYLPIVARP